MSEIKSDTVHKFVIHEKESHLSNQVGFLLLKTIIPAVFLIV